MVGHPRVRSGVGDRQEVARLGTESKFGHLVIENVEIDVRPRERHPAREDPIQALVGNAPHMGAAAQVVVDDPHLGDAILLGPSNKGRSSVDGARD